MRFWGWWMWRGLNMWSEFPGAVADLGVVVLDMRVNVREPRLVCGRCSYEKLVGQYSQRMVPCVRGTSPLGMLFAVGEMRSLSWPEDERIMRTGTEQVSGDVVIGLVMHFGRML
jgi:hypothetical protein